MMTGQADFPAQARICLRVARGLAAAFALVMWLAGVIAAARATNAPPLSDRLAAAQADLAASPTNAALSVRVARLCFEGTTVATNDAAKAKFAEAGIAVARAGLRLHPREAGLEYYLALNLGQLASTRGTGALKLVREMEAHLLAARALDATVSDAGPDRSLAYLYLNAPGWPLSVGSNDKSRHHFEHAVRLAPHNPEHHLAFAEACLRWRKKVEAREHLAQAEAVWATARELYQGAERQTDWSDWNTRLAALKGKLGNK
jgi:hypothetical protein